MEPDTNPIELMLIEDQPIMSAALCQLLGGQPNLRIVGEAATHHDALELAQREQPDIILLDLLADECILDTIPDLLAAAQEARAMVLTHLADLALHRRAVARGALGLVLKEESSQVLLRAIEHVHAGGVWIEGSLLHSVLHDLSQHRQETSRTRAEVALIATITPRESEVLLLIGEGLDNKQIALRLRLSERTVHRHLSALFEKAGVADRLGLAIFAYRTGLSKPTRSAS